MSTSLKFAAAGQAQPGEQNIFGGFSQPQQPVAFGADFGSEFTPFGGFGSGMPSMQPVVKPAKTTTLGKKKPKCRI